MTRQIASWLGGAAMLALSSLPAAAQQAAPPPAPGLAPQATPTADKLATAMRSLAANPQDFDALIAAGDASAQLDDGPAALQFMVRAEKVRPNDARIAAVRGSALTKMGRPGEALRRFADAERGGVSPVNYASDRGLAYDLVGDQPHAQAEYTRALAAGDDAETRRRYAVSLAIAGDAAGADRILDPLLRQQDRASWRTRALVMALAGNSSGAERVTATMMPGFSTAYIPLFRRLSEIRDPADRAFAAHLGEFTRTPARMADAALAPSAPPLPASARPPVAVASAPVAPVTPETSTASRRTETRRAGRSVEDTRRPGSSRSARSGSSTSTDAPLSAAAAGTSRPLSGGSSSISAPAPSSIGSASTTGAPLPSAGVSAPPSRVGVASSAPVRPASTTPASSPMTREVSAGLGTSPAPSPAEVASASARSPSSTLPSSSMARETPTDAATSRAPLPSVTTSASSTPTRPPSSGPNSASPGFSAEVARRTASTISGGGSVPVARGTSNVPNAAPVRPQNDVLASIVRNIAIPGAELGVGPPPPPPAPASPVATSPVEPEPVAKVEPAKPVAVPEPKPAEIKKADTKKPEPAKPEPKKVAAKKPEPKKAAPKPPVEPARWWVQVAGGANASDFPKTWSVLTDKNALLKGKSAWSTPLRFTNRLLTGPFKSSDEAQAFVNKLRGSGMSAFTFQSEEGQKITRLPAK